MILAEKIMKLRKKEGWSQEELAAQLNVSRQSVSKWESGASIPDLDKVVKLSEIFGVSIDYLLKDEMEEIVTTDSGTPETLDDTALVTVEEANTFMESTEKAAKQVAAGVAACILSPVLLILLGGFAEMKMFAISEDMAGGIGVTVLLLMVASAVAVFIMKGMKLERYEYLEKELLSLQYGVAGIVEHKKEQFEPVYKKCIASGVVLCITSAIPLIMAAAFRAEELTYVYCVAMLLALVAFGVYLFVWSGMIYGSYQKLLEEGDYTREKKLENKRNENLSKVYWCTIIAIYLLISFLTGQWQMTWIVWPCAGVFFAAVCGVAAMIRKK